MVMTRNIRLITILVYYDAGYRLLGEYYEWEEH